MQKMFEKLFRQKSEVVPKVQTVEKQPIVNSALIWAIVNALRQSNNSNSMSRFEFNKRLGGGFSEKQVDCAIRYLDKIGVASGDDSRVFLIGGLLSCSACSNCSIGDNWHKPTTCNGRVLMILKNDAGKTCSGWRPKVLGRELSEGWVLEE